MANKKAIALLDGHHYIHVLEAALKHAEESLGYKITGALFLGKPGKLGSTDSLSQLEIPVFTAETDFIGGLKNACLKFEPEVILDMSGQPSLDMKKRLNLAAEALSLGVSYVGPDFSFNALPSRDFSKAPSLAILGAGKRVGKTAVCSYAAKAIAAAGFKPVIITMGRGGPAEPLLVRGDVQEITPEFLVEEATKGRHAASDNYEEALFTKLPTIGCFRAGGGLAGSPFISTVGKGAELANTLDCDFHIFEGSGDTAPPVRTDATVIVTGADMPTEFLDDRFMSLNLRKADIVVITGCEEPIASKDTVNNLIQSIRTLNPRAHIKTAVLRPQPSDNIEGRSIVYATSAPAMIKDTLVSHIESANNCRVTGVTLQLSDRGALKDELSALFNPGGSEENPDTLLIELKAASVQAAVPLAIESNLKVVFCQNTLVSIEPEKDGLSDSITDIARKASEKYRKEHPEETEKH